jgi:hypothetical protein
MVALVFLEGAVGGGANRNRTDDLLNAIQALSQLSYGPSLARGVGNGRVGIGLAKFYRLSQITVSGRIAP